MSLEIEELKAQIIRKFHRRMRALGITRIELVTDDPGQKPEPKQADMPQGPVHRVKQWFSSSFLIRVCEVALLLSVLPTVLPNFKVNYEKPAELTIACIKAMQQPFHQPDERPDPLAPLMPHDSSMTADTHPFPKPLPTDTPDFKLDLRRPCRARTRINS